MSEAIFTNPAFLYAGEAVLLAPTYLAYGHAALQAWRLVRLNPHGRFSYYRILLALVICRAIDYSFLHVAVNIELLSTPYKAVVVSQMFFQWPAGIGITILNMLRLYRVCRSWVPRLVHVLVLAVAASFVLNAYIYVVFIGDVISGADQTFINQLFMVWSGCDVLINATVSGLFLAYLHTSSVRSVDDGGTMRVGMKHLITKIQWILPIEVTVTISNALLQFTAPWMDQYWACYYFSEAIRLVVFSTFLISLNQVMNTRNSTSTRATSGKARRSGGGVRSHPSQVMRSALLPDHPPSTHLVEMRSSQGIR